MAKKLTGYALLRSVCTEEEKKELTKVKRLGVKWDVMSYGRLRPSDILHGLFWWHQSPKGPYYWDEVYKRLRYQEETQGW